MVLLLWGCQGPVSTILPPEERPPLEDEDTTPAPDTADAPDTELKDTEQDTETEVIQGDGEPEDGAWLFDGSIVHDVSLTIDENSWNSLMVAPREYALATFEIGGKESVVVHIRAKGNTSFRTIDDKPSLVIDFNRQVEDQALDGLSSVYMQNMTYDPSMMHEHHAYMFFREVGVPASRTAYANLTVNGENYGLYLFLEKQNRVYRKRWWTDPDGSMFESGSFNWPCDLNRDCNCFEIDELAEGGEQALMDLCAAVNTSDESWLEAARERLDWERFLNAMSAEMVISHYDNYGFSTNNFRIYHDPTDDVWGFTPWSTDLSFGWYPWFENPHCGEHGQSPKDYSSGYLLSRCWSNPECSAELQTAIRRQAEVLESMDMPTRIGETYEMIDEYIAADTRRWYSDWWVDKEVECMIEWAEGRPSALLE